jgi:predicted alpha-1,2-mannosidase
MISIITDAFAKGIRDFDTAAAYTGMSEDACKLRAELESDDAVTRGSLRGESQEDIYLKYDRLGYFPNRPDRTLENCYDNWCVAQMAQMLGKTDDYQKFTRRAQFYRNVWDASIGFFRARDEDGSWLEFPDPTVIDETCVYEATMWQWRWFVLHDVPGLIDLVGGKEKFVADLDHFFSNDLYNAANEQDLHTAFLFNDAGAPWLTQKWVRQILAEPMTQLYGGHAFYNEPYFGRIYRPTPDGYLPEMDDDCGTMASWFVLASMGLYPVCPGQPIYQLTAPLFDRVVIHFDDQLEAGKAFVIEAKNLSAKNIYIQSAQLNGAPYNKAWIAHADIIKGGTLTFEMGAEPNKSWGVTAAMPF